MQITIKGQVHEYDERQVITFSEGLIGLPNIRRAVVLEMNEFKPFCWLAPLDTSDARFVVVDPTHIFDDYEPRRYKDSIGQQKEMLAIVTVSSDWKNTTINLRAPIVVDPLERTATQQILNDSPYHFAEVLPQNS